MPLFREFLLYRRADLAARTQLLAGFRAKKAKKNSNLRLSHSQNGAATEFYPLKFTSLPLSPTKTRRTKPASNPTQPHSVRQRLSTFSGTETSRISGRLRAFGPKCLLNLRLDSMIAKLHPSSLPSGIHSRTTRSLMPPTFQIASRYLPFHSVPKTQTYMTIELISNCNPAFL